MQTCETKNVFFNETIGAVVDTEDPNVFFPEDKEKEDLKESCKECIYKEGICEYKKTIFSLLETK